MMAYLPYANWEAIVLVVIAWVWISNRHESKMALVEEEQRKLKDQLDEANEKLQLYEYCVQEEKIAERCELSPDRHPEMYTEDRIPMGTKRAPGWPSSLVPKAEFAKEIELSRQLFVSEMIALQAKYKHCLQSGAYTEYTDENCWLWFTPAYKHPYYYVSRFVKTGKNNWAPPDVE
jgi:hypothetical protein